MTSKLDYLASFKDVPKTGVIYVLERAVKAGYAPTDPSWANLGQGAPDTGPLEGEDISKNVSITAENSEYAPVSGRTDLRQRIADYYNAVFRKDKTSLYTAKNVCVAGGGRVALSRLVSALGHINLGHFIPDYTAYEELLSVFQSFIPVPITLKKEQNYRLSVDELRDEIVGKGLSACLISNPCNPTGQSIQGEELKDWVSLARELGCVSIYDEFYSHYLYNDIDSTPLLSASEYVDDVNTDPVVIINGLSKNWRSPGWRLGWLLGPEDIVERVSSVGSFLDGGAVHPLQEEAYSMINPETVHQEAAQIQRIFKQKKDYALQRLREMNFKIDVEPDSTFYIWADVSNLPAPLNNCHTFFEACLKEKVITVPGLFFDVNPGQRRLEKFSRYKTYVRISFGPTMESLNTGLDSIERVLQKHA